MILKTWLRFLSFWALFSLLFMLLNQATVLEDQRWKAFYYLPRDSVDVIFIGNSHNYVAIQPQIIDEIIPVDSYVIGSGGENIVLTYFELKEVLRYQHPKMVVVETFVLDLNDELMPTQNYFGFLDGGMWNSNKTAIASRYLTPQTIYTLFPSLRLRIDWGQPHVYFVQLRKFFRNLISPVSDLGGGAAPQPYVISEVDYLAAKEATPRQYPQASVDISVYLNKVLDLCRENDIQLVLLTVPMVNQPQIDSGRYAPFDSRQYAAENQIPLIEFDPGMFTHLHYSEFAHVNEFGSTIISTQVAQQVAVLMDLSIDQKAHSFYQSFSFNDYSITSEDGEYTVQLFPSNNQSMLEFKWSVTDLSNGETIFRDGWAGNNTIHFNLPHTGRYEVNLLIREPSGDFELAAVFSITHED